MQIPIDDIKVKQRARKEFIEIEELAESLNRVGLLNPIIVNQNNVLIAGQRRLEAAKKLGWKMIEARVLSVEDASLALDIEIEENVQRQQFSDEELLNAFARLNRLKNPGFFVRLWRAIKAFFKKIFGKKTQSSSKLTLKTGKP
ncbi:ParB N-terminal domain-containing protein [Treponema putidum]|uniref:Chromosome partitioning protein ParB n=1 Tax=Treponema putidum TaxID=221027 RepID=A0AAE9MTP4_9SPIR|nr:ParB N-terminal domain-containing protein [Treponema putidum]AIN92945.1 plasmid partitioning protein ParB [Treponema putidum]UTY34044.1 chromosome partitioning protein ParB [Treponema putidum]